MTNKVIYKLKGHEKFPLREGWINKGLSVAKEKGTHIFLESQGPDMLGVGTNMVKSMLKTLAVINIINKFDEMPPTEEILKIMNIFQMREY